METFHIQLKCRKKMDSRLTPSSGIPETQIELKKLINYKKSNSYKAIWQIANSVIPYFVLWGLMVLLVHYRFPYWLVLALSVVSAGFLVRIFIIFHDCCHRSFFKSSVANAVTGHLLGILTFTPYEEWKATHLKHHGASGNLDKRGVGDIWTMTVAEYKASSRWLKALYRVVRNPAVLLGLGPVIYFLLAQRIWHRGADRRQRLSVLLTNLFLLTIAGISYLTIGLSTYLMIQLPVIFISGLVGIWLFYVQHQFDGVYWARQEDWDPKKAALEGSSYYQLPRVLQWMTGNIGFHHIHHFKPQIPNYNLERCHKEVREFQQVKTITLRKSLSSLFLNLWHEQQAALVSFRSLKACK